MPEMKRNQLANHSVIFFFRLASCRDATFDFIFTFLIVDANNSQTQEINNGIFSACVSCKYDTASLFWLKVL